MVGLEDPPAGLTDGGWTGNRSWKLGLRGAGRRRPVVGGTVQLWMWPVLSASSVTGEPRIDIDRPRENEATDDRPSDAFIR